jgi:hypothetical protein
MKELTPPLRASSQILALEYSTRGKTGQEIALFQGETSDYEIRDLLGPLRK